MRGLGVGRWASSPFVIVLVLVGGGSCSNVNHVCEKVWWGLLVVPFRRCARLKHVKGFSIKFVAIRVFISLTLINSHATGRSLHDVRSSCFRRRRPVATSSIHNSDKSARMPGEHLPCKSGLTIAYDYMLIQCFGSQMRRMRNRKSITCCRHFTLPNTLPYPGTILRTRPRSNNNPI